MKKIRTAEFIQKAVNVHGDIYDYSLVEYNGHNFPVEIICSVHGNFFQKPAYHIRKRSGCSQCYRDSQKYNKNTFFKMAKLKFETNFEYGEYFGYREQINIVCKKHGSFVTTPSVHLLGDGGCKQCRSEKISIPIADWVARFNAHHYNRYDYSQNTKIVSDQKIIAVCSDHGEFYPIPNNHVKGHGCPKCACVNYVGGYSSDYFIKNPHKKDEVGILYLIRLFDSDEEFFKVGVTNRSTDLRFKNRLPYEYEIVVEHKTTLYCAHLQEQEILQRTDRYTPKKHFSGWTECFDINMLPDLGFSN